MPVVTKGTDDGWSINDPVIRVRPLGAAPHLAFMLPEQFDGELSIGVDSGCDVRLEDPSGAVSRRHATLAKSGGTWTLRDLGSTNGVRQDGELRQFLQLTPGLEIQIGGVVLIAESKLLIGLRALLARLIGWDASREAEVDRALRAVREMANARSPLVICGQGDLTSLVRRLHVLAVGEQRTFTVSPTLPSVDKVGGGTLCAVGRRSAAELATFTSAIRSAGSKVRIAVCCPTRADAIDAAGIAPIVELPAISTRLHEIERLLGEFADDAVVSLAAPRRGFREHEMQWLRPIAYRSLAHVEEVALRVVALRAWGVRAAARKLKISHPALSQWAQRYGIPT